MANVMLTSETARDPNKPFSERVEDVGSRFDALVADCLLLVRSEEHQSNATTHAQLEEQLIGKLEQFNSVCDELYKEILHRKEKLLHQIERGPKNVDLHRQIQTAGNLAQMIGDFKYFLDTGNPSPGGKIS